MKILTKALESSRLLYTKPLIENGICNRCYSKSINGTKCMECLQNCEQLYFVKRINNPNKTHSVNMSFELSPSQKDASKFFKEHYKNHESAFLEAVCGSGKTEIMYETILECLNDHKKPLIAIPRKEIVSELKERLIPVFKDTVIKQLDGSNHDDDADLLISTVHQLVNYEDEFDLIILDEADAFPYAGNDYLHRLVKKALKKDGVLLKMSATRKELITSDTYSVNRRYHNHDLTVPIYIKDYSKDITKNDDFINILKNKSRKYIIYTSSINKAIKLSDSLKCDAATSKNENLDKIIKDFRSGITNILVSTTILERGVTFKNLDVIIADASSEVFNHQTIIQICGRVGRSVDDPTGNVYIFYKNNSIKFKLVNSYIRRMNNAL